MTVLHPEVRIYSGVATYARATAPLGAVPEPATWTMLIVGLGAAGAMLWSRRRQPLPRLARI